MFRVVKKRRWFNLRRVQMGLVLKASFEQKYFGEKRRFKFIVRSVFLLCTRFREPAKIFIL